MTDDPSEAEARAALDMLAEIARRSMVALARAAHTSEAEASVILARLALEDDCWLLVPAALLDRDYG
jgi:hypothetical protein